MACPYIARSHSWAATQSRASRFFSHCRSRARENLPSIAPKPSVSIKQIRQNPEIYSQNCLERNNKAQADHPFKIVKLFDEWRQSQINARNIREKSNATRSQLSRTEISSGIETEDEGAPKGSRDDLIEEARRLKDGLAIIEDHEADLTSQIEALATELPNLTSSETPRQEPRVVGYINEGLRPPPDTESSDSSLTRDHVRIGAELDLLDFSAAATTSGWGWYYLKNEAALLEDALIQYALSVSMKHGFSRISPPSMVYSHITSACGFRPRDQNSEQQIYTIENNEKDKPTLSLAATAEIPFAASKANQTLSPSILPLKIVGYSRCHRAEAGARGANTKGLYRVHEFFKVEMFAWTFPDIKAETSAFDSILAVQIEILRSLGLHCRILEMPSTDLGASAFRKNDIEVFFPSRRKLKDGGWGEVTSASMCTDYQTRRLNTRVKSSGSGTDKMEFPSTVNGTAMAVPRVLAALLEYGCEEREGKVVVRVPEVLWPWMHGVKVIEGEKKV